MRAVVVALTLSLFAPQSYPPPFPRPNAVKLTENDRLVVWDVVWPKGEPSPMHRHVYDQVGTYYVAGGRAITDIKGERRTTATPVGAISTTRKGTLHIEEGITDTPLRAIFIEMKQDGPAGDPPALSNRRSAYVPAGAKQALDTERVTISDYTWQAGDSHAYQHRYHTITVWLSGGTVSSAEDGKPPVDRKIAPGRFEYHERGSGGAFQVKDGAPRAMIFEFK